MNDLRFAFRQLLKNPGFTTIAVLTLALGIGATTSVFSLIHGVLLTPPPYPKPEQVVLIATAKTDGQAYPFACTTAQWIEWQKATNSFGAIAGYEWGFQFLVLPDGSESVQGLFVTPDYFKVIGINPLLGRVFSQADMATRGGNETTIILGCNLWQRRFNGDPDIIGKVVRLSRRRPMTVVGVMPPGVRFLPSRTRATAPNYDLNAHVDFWVPLWPPNLSKPKEVYCNLAGRLRAGATASHAQAEVVAIAATQALADPDFDGITAKVEPLAAELNRNGHRLLLPLMGAVTLVFLIACANVAGLLMARGLQRQREYATRCALGAGRLKLFRQVLTESLLLAVSGAALGGVLGVATVHLIKAIGGFAIPRLDAVTVGWPVLAGCVGSAILAAGIAGFMPALRATQLDPAGALKASGPGSSVGQTERRLFGAMAILQIVLTVALLVGAGLLIRTVNNLAKLDPGYEMQRILTMQVTMPDHSKFADFHAQAHTRLSVLPGVRNVAFAFGVPLTGNKWTSRVAIEGQSAATRLGEELAVTTRSVSADYFEAVSLKITTGQAFRLTDAWYGPTAATNGPFVAVINEAMAEKVFTGENPIGRKLLFPDMGDKYAAEIIGVVANARTETLTRNAAPEIYFSLWQYAPFTKHLVVRTMTDPRALIAAIRGELRAIDPTVAIEHIKTLEQLRADSIASQTFAMRLLAGFSLAGSTLALVGIYGVLSLSVGARRREIAIRTAVGAQRGDILHLVLGQGFRLIGVGLILGIGVALATAHVLRTLLFGVEPNDPATLIGVAVMFATVGLLACWLPARRATKVNPMEALRHE